MNSFEAHQHAPVVGTGTETTFNGQLSQMATTNAGMLQTLQSSYENNFAKMMADNEEKSRRQEEAHRARLEEDRKRKDEELENIRAEQRRREAEQARRMEEERLRRIEAQRIYDQRMAEESKARTGLMQSMKTYIDHKFFGREQTARVEEIPNQPQRALPGTGTQQHFGGASQPQQQFGQFGASQPQQHFGTQSPPSYPYEQHHNNQYRHH